MFKRIRNIPEHTKLTIIKWAYLVIVVAATITLVVVVGVNKRLLNDIQQDRKRVTYDLCLDQNAKNIELINFLNDQNLKEAIEKAKKEGKPLPTKPPPMDPVAKKFVDILAEKRNCQQVVINIFGSPLNEPD